MLKIIASVQKGETESPNLKYVNKVFSNLLSHIWNLYSLLLWV
jgi:hypothetical protein